MLLAAPPHLSAKESLILVTRGGQVRALASTTTPVVAPAGVPSPANKPAPADAPAPEAPAPTQPAVP
jgi:hypothetical protein